VDRAVDTAASEQRVVSRIDDRVDLEGRDIGEDGMKRSHRRVRQDVFDGSDGARPSVSTLSWAAASVYSSAMASNPVNTPSAPPGPAAEGAKSQATKAPDRRLRLEDILKLMVADGLVSTAPAEKLARSRTQRFETPLELIADQKWHSLASPRKVLTLDALVEWLAGKLGVPYFHIDPLKIDLVAVTATMSNAYAERYRILPVSVGAGILTVATSEPFVRSWADELEQILPCVSFIAIQDIRRYRASSICRSMRRRRRRRATRRQ
jgi:hypothetical protein